VDSLRPQRVRHHIEDPGRRLFFRKYCTKINSLFATEKGIERALDNNPSVTERADNHE
jgi:hypothetical protein